MSEFVYSDNKGGKGNEIHYGKGQSEGKGGQFAPKNAVLSSNLDKIEDKVFSDYVKKFINDKKIEVKSDGRPRYDVDANIMYVAENDPQSFVHEFFHALDNKGSDILTVLSGSIMNSGYSFKDMLTEDLRRLNVNQFASNLLDSFKKRMINIVMAEHTDFPKDAIIKAVENTLEIEREFNAEKIKQRELLKKAGATKEQMDEEDMKLHARKIRKRNSKVPKEIRISISNALDKAKHNYGFGAMSDILSAIDETFKTENDFTKTIGTSHTNDYWSLPTGNYRNSSRIASETFAHAGTLKYLFPPLYRKFKEFFPYSSSIFEEIIAKKIK